MHSFFSRQRWVVLTWLTWATPAIAENQGAEAVIVLGSRRELFVDSFLIDQRQNVRLELHQPRDEGPVLKFDAPWEGLFCGYVTVIHDGPQYRLYYRGLPVDRADGSNNEVTCYAESRDGIHWHKPDLGLFEVKGTRKNNVVLAGVAPLTHNFSPFLDPRPGIPQKERFKGLGGIASSGLVAFVSGDGVRWQKLRDQPVLDSKLVGSERIFDSQNVSFYSAQEKCYLCYFRVFVKGVRGIYRSTSADFLTWTKPVKMDYVHDGKPGPVEHHYTNQTHPYFRAPHLYLATAARFLPGRQVLSAEQAKAIRVNPAYFRDTSDVILMSTRGGNLYNRTFLEGFIRPGIGPQNWVSRTNYPALNVVQTGPSEMSIYVNQDYAQPTAHLRRYSLRLDGFASLRALYGGGEMVTKPLTFTGKKLFLNFATSAAGGILIEIQDAKGQPLPGFTLADAREMIGNEIERHASWKADPDLGRLAGQAVRLRFVMKDADLYALRFAE